MKPIEIHIYVNYSKQTKLLEENPGDFHFCFVTRCKRMVGLDQCVLSGVDCTYAHCTDNS